MWLFVQKNGVLFSGFVFVIFLSHPVRLSNCTFFGPKIDCSSVCFRKTARELKIQTTGG